MRLVRRLLSTTAGKLFALPLLLLTLVIGLIVVVTVDDLARGEDPCKSAVYDKSAVVFDAVAICATSGVSHEKVDYAAAVAAQWIDNDQDGVADEPRLLDQLQSTQPVILMTPTGISLWPGIRTLIARRGLAGTQDLGAQETNPDGERRDAAPEEIHHLIMTAGWQKVWPALFGDVSSGGSTLSKAWASAEADQLYQYDDPTCDSDCKVVEFVYLATAAYLGSDADLENEELRIPNQDRLREQSPQVVALFESNDYSYPTSLWPDGQYPHAKNIVTGS